MLMHNPDRVLQTSVDLQQAQTFGIETSAKAFEILSSNIYSDKILAVIRELSCNAYDAHQISGAPISDITIHLPNQMEPWFAVSDKGPGLDHEDMMTLYTTYFKSTKATSNDFIGCMGLGSKSPFAYTDQFTVTSVHNGTKSVYSVYVDDNGTPRIARLSESLSNEDSGLTVKVPVKPNDFSGFTHKLESFFASWDQLPTFTGATVEIESVFEESQPLKDGLLWYEPNTNWNNVQIRQGLVMYPLDRTHFKDLPYFDVIGSVIIDVPMGTLNVAASRESFSYDKASINRFSSWYVSTVAPVIKEYIDTFYDDCPTAWEKMCKYKLRPAFMRNQTQPASTKGLEHPVYFTHHGSWLQELVRHMEANKDIRAPEWTRLVGEPSFTKDTVVLYSSQSLPDISTVKRHIYQIHKQYPKHQIVVRMRSNTTEADVRSWLLDFPGTVVDLAKQPEPPVRVFVKPKTPREKTPKCLVRRQDKDFGWYSQVQESTLPMTGKVLYLHRTSSDCTYAHYKTKKVRVSNDAYIKLAYEIGVIDSTTPVVWVDLNGKKSLEKNPDAKCFLTELWKAYKVLLDTHPVIAALMVDRRSYYFRFWEYIVKHPKCQPELVAEHEKVKQWERVKYLASIACEEADPTILPALEASNVPKLLAEEMYESSFLNTLSSKGNMYVQDAIKILEFEGFFNKPVPTKSQPTGE